MFWEKKPLGRPVVRKLLEPFVLLWGASQIESNLIDASSYAFKHASLSSLAFFVIISAWNFTHSRLSLAAEY